MRVRFTATAKIGSGVGWWSDGDLARKQTRWGSIGLEGLSAVGEPRDLQTEEKKGLGKKGSRRRDDLVRLGGYARR